MSAAQKKLSLRLFAGLAVVLALAVLLIVIPAASQGPLKGTKSSVAVHRVVNMRQLSRQRQLAPTQRQPSRVIHFLKRRLPPIPQALQDAARALQPAPLAPPPQVTPRPLSPAPAINFEALGDINTTIPPDTQGAAGPDHLMVALNSEVRVQDRTGNEVSTVTLNTFWAPTGATDAFDPKVVYDSFNGRWIFTAVSDRRSADSSFLLGVSQTFDPSGVWDLYRIDADATNADWADYPSLGFNKNWIVVTVNMFTNLADNFTQSKVFAFDKSELYNNATAARTEFTSPGGTLAPALTHDDTLETLYLVNMIGSNATNGFLKITSVTGTPAAPVFNDTGFAPPFVITSQPWDDQPPGFLDFAPQLDTARKIQVNDSRILSTVYRNGSIWVSHSVFLPQGGAASRSSLQWLQFSPVGTVQQLGRVDDPTGNIFYGFPTLAVNSRNDVLLGYSVFSATTYASAGYSFRASTDPPNTMQSSVIFKAGQMKYEKDFGGSDNRWGDYSNTVVDPANDLDFWTIQEYAASPAFPIGDDRWGTWWAKVNAPVAKKRRGQVISQ